MFQAGVLTNLPFHQSHTARTVRSSVYRVRPPAHASLAARAPLLVVITRSGCRYQVGLEAISNSLFWSYVLKSCYLRPVSRSRARRGGMAKPVYDPASRRWRDDNTGRFCMAPATDRRGLACKLLSSLATGWSMLCGLLRRRLIWPPACLRPSSPHSHPLFLACIAVVLNLISPPRLWPDNTMPVVIGSDFSSAERDLILMSMRHVTGHTGLRVIERTNETVYVVTQDLMKEHVGVLCGQAQMYYPKSRGKSVGQVWVGTGACGSPSLRYDYVNQQIQGPITNLPYPRVRHEGWSLADSMGGRRSFGVGQGIAAPPM